MLDGLAFLPIADVGAGMNYHRTVVPVKCVPLLSYFDEIYVHGTSRGAAQAVDVEV